MKNIADISKAVSENHAHVNTEQCLILTFPLSCRELCHSSRVHCVKCTLAAVLTEISQPLAKL